MDTAASALKQPFRTLHTLGPHPTNCEKAGHEWFARQRCHGRVVLHDTLEQAVEHVLRDTESALLACIVYPALNEIVFQNLHGLSLVDVFIMPTMSMVLAARDHDAPCPRSVATHPAPASLIPKGVERVRLADSNAAAARLCADGEVDGCVTTIASAQLLGLHILRDFGEVTMGFSIHAPIATPQGGR